ncbi:MAG: hypothetical protein A2Y17_06525 [Clostridiales bacterium GWF2_38_85]|nr:MAG: hypothetical protein A2Y17_06525 [Clostridiales bacterium GWF2_38_85]
MKKFANTLFIILLSICLITIGIGAEATEDIVDKVAVSIGKTYISTGTPSIEADATYGDSGSEMTDGVVGDDTNGSSWTAYQGEPAEIVIDLEKSIDNLVQFDYNIYVWKAAGLNGPQDFTIYVSEDNITWTSINTNNYTDIDNNDVVITPISITLSEGVTARYIKLAINSPVSWTCIDEVTVYQASDSSVAIESTTSTTSENVISDISDAITPTTGDNIIIYSSIIITLLLSSIVVIYKNKNEKS